MKKVILCALLALCTALCGCGQSQLPPSALRQQTPAEEEKISAVPDESASSYLTETLYFRYEETGMLRQEERVISMLPNESREKALVRALLEGPREAGGTALFPDKTEVLSTQLQDGVLFVTFNEALYDRYGDESGAPSDAEALLRRKLAMAALCATLTESGECRSVQVLVRAESNVGASMRLKNSYYLLDDERAAEPLTREETYLPTPDASARMLLEAWKTRSWSALYDFVMASDTRLDAASARFAAVPALLESTVSSGTVSLDGQSAVVCVSMTLRALDGPEESVENWPLHLTRENGVWKAEADAVYALMQSESE